MRGGTGAITGSPKNSMFGLALGAVSCSFKKELKPFETYELWSRILSWDEKWIYVVTHFVRKGAVMPRRYTLYPQQNGAEQEEMKRRGSDSSMDSMDGNDSVVATALSKCVFKTGRRTISPNLMLRLSGLLPTEELAEKFAGDTGSGATVSSASSDSGIDMSNDQDGEETEADRIENERQRGMKIAASLASKAQTDLENEFTAENDALGRHTDGAGIVGVVSTLAQLAHLSPKSVL
jgi:hypothetical protein